MSGAHSPSVVINDAARPRFFFFLADTFFLQKTRVNLDWTDSWRKKVIKKEDISAQDKTGSRNKNKRKENGNEQTTPWRFAFLLVAPHRSRVPVLKVTQRSRWSRRRSFHPPFRLRASLFTTLAHYTEQNRKRNGKLYPRCNFVVFVLVGSRCIVAAARTIAASLKGTRKVIILLCGKFGHCVVLRDPTS